MLHLTSPPAASISSDPNLYVNLALQLIKTPWPVASSPEAPRSSFHLDEQLLRAHLTLILSPKRAKFHAISLRSQVCNCFQVRILGITWMRNLAVISESRLDEFMQAELSIFATRSGFRAVSQLKSHVNPMNILEMCLDPRLYI